MRKFLQLITNIETAVRDTKKKKNLSEIISIQIVSSLLIALSVFLIGVKIGKITEFFYTGITVFILLFTGMFVAAYFIEIIMDVLVGKGSYTNALIATVYSMVSPSVGMIIAGLLLFIPYSSVFSVLILIYTIAMGNATFFRMIKELYKTDYITVFVAVSVFTTALIVGIWIGAVYTGIGIVSTTVAV